MKATLTKGLEILFLLASHRFGLTRAEICDDVALSQREFFRYMNSLKSSGVVISAQIEPMSYGTRHAWRKLYRLRTIRGQVFSLTTRLVPTNHG